MSKKYLVSIVSLILISVILIIWLMFDFDGGDRTLADKLVSVQEQFEYEIDTCSKNCSSNTICECFKQLAKDLMTANNLENDDKVLYQMELTSRTHERKSETKIIFMPYTSSVRAGNRTHNAFMDEKCNFTTQTPAKSPDAILFTDFPEADLQKWESYPSRNSQIWIYNMKSLPKYLHKSNDIYFDWTSTRSLSSHVPVRNRIFNKNKLIDHKFESLKNKSIVVTSNLCTEKVNSFLDKLKERNINTTRCCSGDCSFSSMLLPKDTDIMKFVLLVELDKCSHDFIDDMHQIIAYQHVPVIIGPVIIEDIFPHSAPNNTYYRLESLDQDNIDGFVTLIKNWQYDINAMHQVEDASYYKRLCTLVHVNPNISKIDITQLTDDEKQCRTN